MKQCLVFCRYAVITALLSILPTLSFAADWPSWPVWLAQFKKEAVADGINPQFFDHIFADVFPNKQVIHFDKRQPEKRLTFLQYRTSRADNFRIQLGRKEYGKHKELLEQVGKQFGVDPCIIASIWGMETSYGRYMGDFPVIKALATLAYDQRRSQFFRKELLIALHILQEGHISEDQFKGEWAGASGLPQFLPSSWKRYAVDFDQDGHKNIWTSLPDAFASIANYLTQNGWHANQPWALEVTLPSNFDKNLIATNAIKTVAQWQALGVRTKSGAALPSQELSASVIEPYGGPDFLKFNNFSVLLRYNNSNFYAGTIGYMADQICRR